MRVAIFVGIGAALTLAGGIAILTNNVALYWGALGTLAGLVTGAMLALGDCP